MLASLQLLNQMFKTSWAYLVRKHDKRTLTRDIVKWMSCLTKWGIAHVETFEFPSAPTELQGLLSFRLHYCHMMWPAFVENIVKENWKCNLMSVLRITDVLLHVDEQQEVQERETETEWVSHKDSLSLLYHFIFVFLFLRSLSLSLKCTHCFAPRRRMKEQSRERRPHSDIFICVVLTQLNSPSEKLMRRNGLVEEPTGCIHSCHHHLNPGVLNLQLWPPTWMGNDLSVLVWHPLCLQQNHSSSIYNNASLLNPRQHRSMSSSWM